MQSWTSTDPGGGTVDARQNGPSSRASGLSISELMYHPAPRTDGLDTEYVEVLNTEPVAVELGGYRLSGDVDYTFPTGLMLGAGERVVVAGDPHGVELGIKVTGKSEVAKSEVRAVGIGPNTLLTGPRPTCIASDILHFRRRSSSEMQDIQGGDGDGQGDSCRRDSSREDSSGEYLRDAASAYGSVNVTGIVSFRLYSRWSRAIPWVT